ncbi:hypothetical protein SAMN05421788_110197 [Filimonas lacunae]|uniref:Uncharacterized protein n=1 Tax=Filimonas lacunae TaxID=477680 RepID=A0A1N7R8U7_9BACT|nr:hypothetical protein [Filimonas lacunae]SIT31495.1 hypothetical protein SAMN05421788_110197 [Filimonas lacunae]
MEELTHNEYLCKRYYCYESTAEELKEFFALIDTDELQNAMVTFLEKRRLSGEMELDVQNTDRILRATRKVLGLKGRVREFLGFFRRKAKWIWFWGKVYARDFIGKKRIRLIGTRFKYTIIKRFKKVFFIG